MKCPYCNREFTLREKLLQFLMNKNNLSISQIHSSFKNYDYKAVYKQIKNLEKEGVLYLKQEKKKQGKPVFVTLRFKLKDEN